MVPGEFSTPAVVLKMVRDRFQHTGLAVARTLGRLGVPVYGVQDDRLAAGAGSRYFQAVTYPNLWERSDAERLDYLLLLAKQIGRPALLIPTDDVASVFVDDHAEALAETFIFPRLPDGLARQLSSKRELYHLCKQHGIPTPEIIVPKGRADVEDFLRTRQFPVVVKSDDPELLRERPAAKSVLILHNRAEVIEYYEAAEDPAAPNLILQEYIPGSPNDVWMFNGYFDWDSNCLLGVTGHKIRQAPPYTGATTLGICRRNDTVTGMTVDLMQTLSYRGVLDLGYRYDPRDGTYKLLDVNPRVGGAFRLLCGANGLDVIRTLYLDMTGQSVPVDEPDEGRRWMVENMDLISSIKYHRDGVLSARDWLHSLRDIHETAWIAKDDVAPFLRLLLLSSLQAARALLGRRRSALALALAVPWSAMGDIVGLLD
jgi:D-aspartate ligase